MRNITETPDKWVILKLPNDEYKVFASWAGGYLTSDSWKVNSGIEKVEQDDDYYYIIGYSGSSYKCHKKGYGVATSYSYGILTNILSKSNNQIEFVEPEELNLVRFFQ